MNKFCVNLIIDRSDELLSIMHDIVSEHEKKLVTNHARQIFRITQNQFPSLLLDFLEPFNLTIIHGEIFFLPPESKHTIHVDGEHIDNHCKINWAIGGGESLMEWYRPLDEKAFIHLITDIGTKYLSFDSRYCEKVFESKIGNPSLINAGQPHTVQNCSNEDRWAITYVIGNIKTRKKVQWDEVFPLLEKYRKEK